MARVNIVKQIKIDGNWVLRSIPKKPSGTYDWTALPEGTYFIEWRDSGQRKREPAGITASQALEAQRKKRHSLEGHRWNIRSSVAQPSEDAANSPLQALIERYLEQVETLKKPNTFRKYECVLQRFGEHFRGRTLSDITVEQLNDFVVKLKKGGMSANTVLHNVIIIAQFSKRNGRLGITKQLQLPEQILPLPKVYTEQELAKFFVACDPSELAMFATFLLTGFREQEVMYLFWSDVSSQLRTVRVGNVIMPTLAALFFALGVLRYAHGQAHTYAPWAGFLCLMVSGVLRGIEKFAAQAAWNNPDLVWITMRGMVNWTCNVFLPVYAVLQLLQGFMLYAGIGHRMYAGGAWMRHFGAAAMCLALSGVLRLAEWFIAQGLGGIS